MGVKEERKRENNEIFSSKIMDNKLSERNWKIPTLLVAKTPKLLY